MWPALIMHLFQIIMQMWLKCHGAYQASMRMEIYCHSQPTIKLIFFNWFSIDILISLSILPTFMFYQPKSFLSLYLFDRLWWNIVKKAKAFFIGNVKKDSACGYFSMGFEPAWKISPFNSFLHTCLGKCVSLFILISSFNACNDQKKKKI